MSQEYTNIENSDGDISTSIFVTESVLSTGTLQ